MKKRQGEENKQTTHRFEQMVCAQQTEACGGFVCVYSKENKNCETKIEIIVKTWNVRNKKCDSLWGIYWISILTIIKFQLICMSQWWRRHVTIKNWRGEQYRTCEMMCVLLVRSVWLLYSVPPLLNDYVCQQIGKKRFRALKTCLITGARALFLSHSLFSPARIHTDDVKRIFLQCMKNFKWHVIF